MLPISSILFRHDELPLCLNTKMTSMSSVCLIKLYELESTLASQFCCFITDWGTNTSKYFAFVSTWLFKLIVPVNCWECHRSLPCLLGNPRYLWMYNHIVVDSKVTRMQSFNFGVTAPCRSNRKKKQKSHYMKTVVSLLPPRGHWMLPRAVYSISYLPMFCTHLIMHYDKWAIACLDLQNDRPAIHKKLGIFLAYANLKFIKGNDLKMKYS